MPVFVFAEQRDGRLNKTALEALSQGRRIADSTGDRLIACLVGNDISSLAYEIDRYGADQVLLCQDETLSLYHTETYAAVLANIIEDERADLILFGNTAMGKDLAPRVAEKVGAGLVSDCTAMELSGDEIRFLRPMYAGKVIAKVRVSTRVKMATLRPNNFSLEEKPGKAQVKAISCGLPVPRTKVKEIEVQEGDRPELTEAEVIVSGGRGLGKPEGFQLIEKVADALGAAVGASRAAVDAGWRSQQHQVGQTGKVVTPNLYVACGISGAIQHMAGMGTSKCIVAINKDGDAKLMEVADLAIKGDLYEVLPELLKQLQEFQDGNR